MPSNCGTGEDFWKSSRQRGDWSWIFTERTDAEAEASVFWSSDVNRWLIGQVPDAGIDCGQKEKRASEDEIMQWTWTWANARRCWSTGKLGVLQSMGSQRAGHPWAIEQQQHRLSDLGVWDKSGYIPGRFQKITVSEARNILPQESMRQYLSLGKRIVKPLPPT